MSSPVKLAINYAIIAFIATLANIGAQDSVIRVYVGTSAVYVSILVGTGVGLIVKYLLDKRFIFRFCANDLKHDIQTFLLYTTMGIFTTVIFWGFELGFDYLFASKGMRYLGAVTGLCIGYVTKYHLDKRYVFRGEMA